MKMGPSDGAEVEELEEELVEPIEAETPEPPDD